MLSAFVRMVVGALTPPAPRRPVPSNRIPVRSYTRKKPVNAKREALHEQLRRELGR